MSARSLVASPFLRERARVRVKFTTIAFKNFVSWHMHFQNPSPPAFVPLRRGRQSSLLQKGERRLEATHNARMK
jgi:hypothetical protein